MEQQLKNADRIFFVCSGNILRSAFAEILTHYLLKDNRIGSFGTTYQNNSIHIKSKEALLDRGIHSELINSFEPTFIEEIISEITASSVMLCMTNDHISRLEAKMISSDNIYLLTEILNKKEEIQDPYFHDNFEEAFQTIEKAVIKLVKIIDET